MSDNRVVVPLQIALRSSTVAMFNRLEQDLGLYVATLLEAIADGGCFVTVDQINSVEKAIGKPIGGGIDLVAAAQKSGDIVAGKHVFPVYIDPDYLRGLEELARIADPPVTVPELVRITMDRGLENGWAGVAFEAGGVRHTFTIDQERAFGEILNNPHFTVADLLGYVRQASRGRKAPRVEEPVAV